MTRLKSGLLNPQFAIPLLLLALAMLFLLPGLPPFRVEAPMEQLLIFPPWSTLYPQADPLLRGSDVLFQQLPWHHWIQDELRAERFPLWVSGPLGGYPLFAYYQAAVLYPLHLLWALLPTGAGSGIIMVLKLWIAGLGMWGFLRALGLRTSAALLGALGFMFSAGLIEWMPWSHTNVYILLPWLCWAAYRWCYGGKRGALVGFAFLWACALLGGSPEFFFIVAVCTGIWSLGLIVGRPPGRWGREWAWQAGGIVLAVLVGTLIAAVQLLPFFESLGLSHITTIRPTDFTAGIDRARAHLGAGIMLDWVMPRWWGQIYDQVLGSTQIANEANGYVGQVALIGLPLAAIGAFRRQVNLRFVLPWLIVAALCWVVVYDDQLGIWIRILPGFSQTVDFRFYLAIAFAFLVMGAFGWDWLASRIERWREPEAGEDLDLHAQVAPHNRTWGLGGLALAVLAALYLLAHWAGVVPPPNVGIDPAAPKLGRLYPPNADYRLYWTSWEIAVLIGILGATLAWWGFSAARRGSAAATDGVLSRFVRLAPILPLLIGAFLVADLWQLLYTFNQTAPSNWYYPQTSFIKQVVADVPPTERLIADGEALLTHTGLIYGFRDWRAQEPMFTQRALVASTLLDPDYRNDGWNRYNMIMHDIQLPVAPLLGIRYFVFPKETDPNHPATDDPGRPNFKRLAFTEGLGLWEMEGVPGFAYLSDNVTPVPGEDAARTWMGSLTWEQVRAYSAVVEAPQSALGSIVRAPDGSSPGAVSVSDYTPGHIVLDVDASRTSLLAVSESYYPGWNATLDGRPTPILRTNYLSQGILVPAGKHTIEMKYEPASFRNGVILSGAGLLGLLGLFVWWRRGVRAARVKVST